MTLSVVKRRISSENLSMEIVKKISPNGCSWWCAFYVLMFCLSALGNIFFFFHVSRIRFLTVTHSSAVDGYIWLKKWKKYFLICFKSSSTRFSTVFDLNSIESPTFLAPKKWKTVIYHVTLKRLRRGWRWPLCSSMLRNLFSKYPKK